MYMYIESNGLLTITKEPRLRVYTQSTYYMKLTYHHLHLRRPTKTWLVVGVAENSVLSHPFNPRLPMYSNFDLYHFPKFLLIPKSSQSHP
jgi:hypothetical protein